jgi:hypothetical protein
LVAAVCASTLLPVLLLVLTGAYVSRTPDTETAAQLLVSAVNVPIAVILAPSHVIALILYRFLPHGPLTAEIGTSLLSCLVWGAFTHFVINVYRRRKAIGNAAKAKT